MQIESFYVKGLFGHFDHEVPLNADDRITIIHGPNGTGKTAMLRLLHGVMNATFTALFETPFSEFGVAFDSGQVLKVTPSTESLNTKRGIRVSKSLEFSFGEDEWQLSYLTHQQHISTSRNRPPENRSQKSLFVASELPANSGRLGAKTPGWYSRLRSSEPMLSIDTHRLTSNGSQSTIIERYCKAITAHIQAALAEYATNAQKLEQSLNARAMQWTVLSPQEYERRLDELNALSLRLQAVGLLERSHLPTLSPLPAEETVRAIVAFHLSDFENKLRILEPLARKIELFLELINSRFRNKHAVIQPESGFEFRNTSGEVVPVNGLSSGEQHHVLLTYELLFNAQEGSFVLMDEPEISLHIAWQQLFISGLERILQLIDARAVVATHSPFIIHDRWELTVELKDQVHEEVVHGT